MADKRPPKPNPRDDRSGMPQRTPKSDPAALPDAFKPLTRIERTSTPAKKAAPTPAQPTAEPTAKPAAKAAPAAKAPQPATPPAAMAEPTPAAQPLAPLVPPTVAAPPTEPSAPRPLPRSASRAAAAPRPATPSTPGRPSTSGSTAARSSAPDTAPLARDVPAAPSTDTGHMRRRLLVGGAALAVLLVIGVVATSWLRGPDAPDAPGSSAAATDDASLDSPLTLVEDSEYVETRVRDDGHLVVTHWIQSSEPMDSMTITVPTRPGLEAQAVTVEDLVVAADGVEVDAPDTSSGAEWTDELGGAQTLFVQYDLSGALQLSDSAEGRALATMTSLIVDVERDLVTKTQAFPGAQVLTLACLPPGTEAMPRPCGTLDADTWTVVSDPDHVQDTVIGQFDLSG